MLGPFLSFPRQYSLHVPRLRRHVGLMSCTENVSSIRHLPLGPGLSRFRTLPPALLGGTPRRPPGQPRDVVPPACPGLQTDAGATLAGPFSMWRSSGSSLGSSRVTELLTRPRHPCGGNSFQPLVSEISSRRSVTQSSWPKGEGRNVGGLERSIDIVSANEIKMLNFKFGGKLILLIYFSKSTNMRRRFRSHLQHSAPTSSQHSVLASFPSPKPLPNLPAHRTAQTAAAAVPAGPVQDGAGINHRE